MTRDQVVEFIKKTNILEEKVDFAIELLCELTFLGLEVAPGKFDFIYDENRQRVLQSLARKTAEAKGTERFAINVPFHSYLEICSGQVVND